MAELAPMPTASVSIATAVKAGFFLSIRSAYFKSCRNICIVAVLRRVFTYLGQAWFSQMKVVRLVNTTEVGMVARENLPEATETRLRSQNVILNAMLL